MSFSLSFCGKELTLGGAIPRVMGILNVTPDSFSDGGRFWEPAAALLQARKMLAEGAAILDIGGESTRPGHTPVPAEEQMRRVLPIIRELHATTETPISIDTTLPEVAEAALEAGASLVNDVSGLGDPEMPSVLARHRAGCVIMHGETLSAEADPISDVREWLSRRLAYACAKTGLPREHFLLDPGIGFGKTPLQNLQLLAKLPELRAIGQPILLALSRKSYIAAVSGEKEAAKRLPGTIASLVLTRTACDIVRVHDVAETLQAFHTAAAIDSLR